MQPNTEGEPAIDAALLKKKLLSLILTQINFPYPTKCVHSVCLDILSLMEQLGIAFPKTLAESICRSSEGDVATITTIREEIGE